MILFIICIILNEYKNESKFKFGQSRVVNSSIIQKIMLWGIKQSK